MGGTEAASYVELLEPCTGEAHPFFMAPSMRRYPQHQTISGQIPDLWPSTVTGWIAPATPNGLPNTRARAAGGKPLNPKPQNPMIGGWFDACLFGIRLQTSDEMRLRRADLSGTTLVNTGHMIQTADHGRSISTHFNALYHHLLESLPVSAHSCTSAVSFPVGVVFGSGDIFEMQSPRVAF